jgi:hypothetical protein
MLKILKNFLPIPAKNTNIFIKTLSYFDVFGLFQKDPFGNWMVLKRMVIFIAGWPTYWRIAIANKLKIEGLENLKDLPNTNVFFISNHQTYFADVITFYHIFCNLKWGFGKKLMPIYLFSPRASINNSLVFVSALVDINFGKPWAQRLADYIFSRTYFSLRKHQFALLE